MVATSALKLLAFRVTAATMALWLVLTPSVPVHAASLGIERAESVESFSFSEAAPAAAMPGATSTRANALQGRTAPVSSSGAFEHRIPIDVPPGRLDMTPSLALHYSSSAAHQDSSIGAGWTLAVPLIARATRDGFPAVDESGATPRYDDAKAVFDAPAGRLVPLDCAALPAECPSNAHGQMFVPERETTAVRYEHIPPSMTSSSIDHDLWIEHDPSGVKRYSSSKS